MKYHLRRRDKEVSNPAMLTKILRSAKYVTLALCADNQPYLVSLSYGYDKEHKCIYFHCAKEGKKLDYLKSNNVVWGQALLDRGYSEGECKHQYASVHFSGEVIFIEDANEKLAGVKCMIRHLDSKPDALIAEFESKRLENTMICRVDIKEVTGKKSDKATL